MSIIFNEFQSLIHGQKNYKARGFTNVCCPACGDKRFRGGFAPTESGGFRYFCFNGGCEFNLQPTGWEPGNGLTGRVRHLYELLGGDIRRIPLKERFRQNDNVYDRNGNLVGQEKPLEVVTKFSEVDLPEDSLILEQAMEEDDRAVAVAEWLNKRSPLFMETEFPFVWSSKHPDHLIVPYIHHGTRVVGYLGRHIKKTSGGERFIQKAPANYMFQQHLLMEAPGPYVFVVESPLDAILLQGVATRDNRLSEKQINLLNLSGKKPILIPDQKVKEEAGPYIKAAEENGWSVSVPEWKFKDPGEAITQNGLLWTIEAITSSKTKNYKIARHRMTKQG